MTNSQYQHHISKKLWIQEIKSPAKNKLQTPPSPSIEIKNYTAIYVENQNKYIEAAPSIYLLNHQLLQNKTVLQYHTSALHIVIYNKENVLELTLSSQRQMSTLPCPNYLPIHAMLSINYQVHSIGSLEPSDWVITTPQLHAILTSLLAESNSSNPKNRHLYLVNSVE